MQIWNKVSGFFYKYIFLILLQLENSSNSKNTMFLIVFLSNNTDPTLQTRIRDIVVAVNSVTGLHFNELRSPPIDQKTRFVFFINRRGVLPCIDYTNKNFTNEGVQVRENKIWANMYVYTSIITLYKTRSILSLIVFTPYISFTNFITIKYSKAKLRLRL